MTVAAIDVVLRHPLPRRPHVHAADAPRSARLRRRAAARADHRRAPGHARVRAAPARPPATGATSSGSSRSGCDLQLGGAPGRRQRDGRRLHAARSRGRAQHRAVARVHRATRRRRRRSASAATRTLCSGLRRTIASADVMVCECTGWDGPTEGGHLWRGELEQLIAEFPRTRFVLSHLRRRGTVAGAILAHDLLVHRRHRRRSGSGLAPGRTPAEPRGQERDAPPRPLQARRRPLVRPAARRRRGR